MVNLARRRRVIVMGVLECTQDRKSIIGIIINISTNRISLRSGKDVLQVKQPYKADHGMFSMIYLGNPSMGPGNCSGIFPPVPPPPLGSRAL